MLLRVYREIKNLANISLWRGVIVDRRTFLAESQDSPREAQRRDARLPRSHTVLQIMPHCRKRSSSTRPEGRSGNGSGGKRIPADTAKPEC